MTYQPTNSVSKQGWPSAEGMKCPSSRFCSMMFLTSWVSISWGHSPSPMETLTFVVDYVEAKATKTNDAKVVVDFVKSNIFPWFRVLGALISDQGSHFCNNTMALMSHKLYIFYRPKKRLSRVHLDQEEESQPRLTPPRPGESSRLGPISSNPLKSSHIRSGPIASSTLAIQHRGHLNSSSTATSFLEKLAAQVTQGVFEFTHYTYPLYSIFTLSFSPFAVVHDAALVSLLIEEVQTTKNDFIKLASLSGTQVLLCLCVKLSEAEPRFYQV
ncbi:hypothetical protein CR513_31669, partial [Mucuna pruriens]